MSQEMTELKKTIEAIIFAAGNPVGRDAIAKALELDPEVVEGVILDLAKDYDEEERGMRIVRIDDTFQMCTRPKYYEKIRLLYRSWQKATLTETQLEVLSIIAYKQPVTKQEVSDIRGVNSENIVNRLMEYDLVGEVGRLKAPGRPILLGTTASFLKNFGFESVKDLPGLPEENANQLDLLASEQMELDGMDGEEEKAEEFESAL